MDTIDGNSNLNKINGHVPVEIKNFFLEYRKERSKKFKTIPDLYKFYLQKYLKNPRRLKYEPEKIETYRQKINNSTYRNNTYIFLSDEESKEFERLAFANYRTPTAHFNLFLFSLYFKLNKGS